MKKILFVLLSVYSVQSFAWGLQEFSEEAASPWTTNARTALWIGGGATLVTAVFEDNFDASQDDIVNDKPLGDFSRFGDLMGQMVPNIIYMGGQSIAGYYGNDKGYDRAIGMFKATAYSSLVTTGLKYTIREPRPNDHSTRNSFPSGHSTTAFAFSGYIASEHGWGWGSAALVLSTFVGASRINDNMHRTHDVLAGATIGWVYGWGISQLQKKKNKEQTTVDEHPVSVMPILDRINRGIALYSEF